MEGLRGVAVLLVFGVHFSGHVGPWIRDHFWLDQIAATWWTIGHSGVDLFFVLSGYLIYGSLIERTQAFLPYFRRRLQRIYPTFLAVLGLYVVLSMMFPQESKIPSGVIPALSYLAVNSLLLPGITAAEPMITVAWSLSYEMFFYLLIPAAVAGLGLRDRSRSLRVMLFLGTALGLASYTALHGGHIRLVMFLGGMLLFEGIRARTSLAPSSWIAMLAVAAGLAVQLMPLGGSAGYTLKILTLFVAFPLLCAAAFNRPGEGIGRGLSFTPLRWLGNMSYSYYLIHGVTLKGFFLFAGPYLPREGVGVPGFMLLMMLGMLATLFTSAVLYVNVERRYSLTPAPPAKAHAQSA
jgi:peptidoglycan/LPS O-acetylase OafA/YrhL